MTIANYGTDTTSGGTGYQTRGLPQVAANASQDATATLSTALSATVKASIGNALGWTANNADTAVGLYLCIINKATAPANGDPIVWAIYAPPSSTVSLFPPNHLKCSAGVSFAWSTTAGTVTLPASVTGNACVLWN